MFIGMNITKCIHCGAEIHYSITAGSIPDVCPGCEDAGHSGTPLDCPVCWQAPARAYERHARIDAALAASLGDPITLAERRRRERTRAALAESHAARERPSEVLRWIAEALNDWEPGIDEHGNFTPEAADGRG